MHSGIIAAIAVVFASYAAYFVPLSPAAQQAAAIAINQLVADPVEAVIGLLLVGSGLPAYYLFRRRSRVQEEVSCR